MILVLEAVEPFYTDEQQGEVSYEASCSVPETPPIACRFFQCDGLSELVYSGVKLGVVASVDVFGHAFNLLPDHLSTHSVVDGFIN